ncbi:Xaa-Pro peptidase family protein [Geobacter sp. DSM 9736]|uniref:M24 family metallopeptidase n=1 Tax=Geobacter sp. DSM 9736 TaxID=1277350 RepID=UPI000B503795|nr:M24 family metallopeptidase [Geobacter sp. DSM 9736]SNB47507.1 Metallopeptidase family M24 [Geobacter sp. DSM 9736]
MKSEARRDEVIRKLDLVRRLAKGRTVRLRGIDWFAWATGGGSSNVLLAAETGIAEIIITPTAALVITDEIEAKRLQDEELPDQFSLHAAGWSDPQSREHFVSEVTGRSAVMSDRPAPGEEELPTLLVAAKRQMTSPEVARYREVGAEAAKAMTETLLKAEPGWTELELAGAGAAALLARGLDPALVMAAGDRRLQLYRHPMPKQEKIGSLAMLVFCARGYGLYANLTRFVSFGKLPHYLAELHLQVREVEARVLAISRPGTRLSTAFETLARAYQELGHPEAIREHHQGGTTGYLSRESVATPGCTDILSEGSVVAWNPSLVGAKIEDTFLVTAGGIDNLTRDERWPTIEVNGIERPVALERS